MFAEIIKRRIVRLSIYLKSDITTKGSYWNTGIVAVENALVADV